MSTFEYRTIKTPGTGLYKEKGSKFIGLTFRVESEEQVKKELIRLKKEYHDARHHCYAYRLWADPPKERANDDGEPSGSAGKPILNQIYSKELFNTLIVVVRYFGGTKLGVSGLVSAYKHCSMLALEESALETVTLTRSIRVVTKYDHVNELMRIIKKNDLSITDQRSATQVDLTIEVPLFTFDSIFKTIKSNIHFKTEIPDE